MDNLPSAQKRQKDAPPRQADVSPQKTTAAAVLKLPDGKAAYQNDWLKNGEDREVGALAGLCPLRIESKVGVKET